MKRETRNKKKEEREIGRKGGRSNHPGFEDRKEEGCGDAAEKSSHHEDLVVVEQVARPYRRGRQKSKKVRK